MGFFALDDRDSAITYSAGWGQAGSEAEYNGTTTFTRQRGATATVTFNGLGIRVLGTIAGGIRDRPSSSYAIDGGTPVVFEGAPRPIGAQYFQTFFQSPTLPDGPHTLVITNTGTDASLFLDYFLVTPVGDGVRTVTTTATTTTTQAGTITASRVVTVTATPTGTAVGAGAASGEQKGGSNAGAIAGGIIGGLVLLALIAAAAMFWKRRKAMERDAGVGSGWASNAKPLSSEPQLPLAPQFPGSTYNTAASGPAMSQTQGYDQWGQYPSQSPAPYVTANPTGGSNAYPPAPPVPPHEYNPNAYGHSPTTNYAPSMVSYGPGGYNGAGVGAGGAGLGGGGGEAGTDLAYYGTQDMNAAYGGYVSPGQPNAMYQQQPVQQGSPSMGPRTRVNLDGP